MARTLSWLPQLHTIRRSVANSVRSHYERKDLELLFRLQPAAAGKLLDILPTTRVGSSLLVERDALATFLKRVDEAGDVAELMREIRRERSTKSRRKLRSLKRQDYGGMAALPSWVKLTRGRLEIGFATADQLAEGMLLLAAILESDLAAFVEAYEPAQPARDQDRKAGADMRELLKDLEARERTKKAS
jgi:hypothetical protein